MLFLGPFLLVLASAGIFGGPKNDGIYGLNGCEAEPFPRKQIKEPVTEFFYSFKIADIPKFEHDKEANTVKLPMNELLQGWYYHNSAVSDLVDAGVVEWYFFPNPSSLFTHTNWGTAENLMTVMKDGTLNTIYQRDIARLTPKQKSQDDYVWEDADHKRRYKVNMHGAMTGAQKQFKELSFDEKQTDEVVKNPEPVPDFTSLRTSLKDALKDTEFPLSPGDHKDKKVSTNCLHGESPDYNTEYVVMELEKERVYHKGQTLFPLKIWTNVAGRSYWKLNEEMQTLELYFKGFQMGHLDARQPHKKVTYFQSPPYTTKDNRVNLSGPKFGNANLQRPFCNYPEEIRGMEEDVHMFWEPVDVVCPPEKLQKFDDLIRNADFTTLVEKDNVVKEMKLLHAATDYVMCGNNYLRSYIKYSHGYDFLEAGAFLHYLLEFYPPFVVTFLTHPDLNQFKIGYIYGKEAPAPPALANPTGLELSSSSSESSESEEAAAPMHTLDQEYHLKETNMENEWSKEEEWIKKESRRKEEEAATVTMVEAGPANFVVNGFAFVGFASLMYGAYAHYFGQKTGDQARVEMA
jgi:hypothetical protein